MLVKRVAALLALVFGALGGLACVVGIFAVGLAGFWLEQANDKVFAALDKVLASAQDRVRGVLTRMEEAKITSTEIRLKLKNWTTVKAKERLLAQVDIEDKADKLVTVLQAAGTWVGRATESIQRLQDILVVGDLLGAAVDPESLKDLLEKLEETRSTLQQAERLAEGVRRFAVPDDGESEANRADRVLKRLARVLLTIGEMDTRLETAVTLLTALQEDARAVKNRTSNHIFLTTVGGYLLLAWIAAGQFALCLCGWSGCTDRQERDNT